MKRMPQIICPEHRVQNVSNNTIHLLHACHLDGVHTSYSQSNAWERLPSRYRKVQRGFFACLAMLASTIVRSVAPVFFLFRRGKTGVGRPSRGMSVGSPRENTASTSWASIRLPFGHFFLKCVWIRGCRSYLFPIAGHGQAPRRWKAANRSNRIFHTLPSPVGSLSGYAKYKTFQGEEGGFVRVSQGPGLQAR